MSETQLIVREVSWSEVWPQGLPHFVAHEKELGLDDPRWPVDVDVVQCAELNSLGVLRIVGAHDAGVLVGYAFWFLTPNLLSRNVLVAQQGPYYVVPEWRKQGRLALRIWLASLEMLRSTGVKQVSCHRFPRSPEGLARFYEKSGGVRREEVWEIAL